VQPAACDKSWTLYWRDRNLRFHPYDLLAPSHRLEDPPRRDRPRPHLHVRPAAKATPPVIHRSIQDVTRYAAALATMANPNEFEGTQLMTPTDYDRELLAATSSRHLHTLPVAVSNAISAAVDELTDPLVLPLLFEIDQEQTRDLPGVLTASRARLLTASQTAATAGQSLAYARAARELSAALHALQPPAPR
jgi:hypothetical protein